MKGLTQCRQVITADGKTLLKVLSAYAPPQLPLEDTTLAAYLLDPTRTAYGLTYLSEKFAVPFTDNPPQIEVPLLHTLAVMEMNGFTIDRQKLEDMEQDLSRQADVLEEAIYDDAGEVFNVNSTKQLGTILFQKL